MARCSEKRLHRFSSMSLILAIGCGTFVGNPKKPGEETAPKQEEEVLVPEIELAVNDAFFSDSNGLSLTSNRDVVASILHAQLLSARKTVVSLNSQIRRINSQRAKIGKTFRRLGSDGTFSLSSGIYNEGGKDWLQITYCRDSSPFLYVTWDRDARIVKVYRDFNSSDSTEEYGKQNLKTFLEIEKTSGGSRFTAQNTGLAWVEDPDEPTHLEKSERIEIDSYSDRIGVKSLAVSGQSDDLKKSYLTSVISQQGLSWTFLGWKSTSCRVEFDENATSPEWCFGRRKNEGFLGASARRKVWEEELKSVGLIKTRALKEVSLPANAKCE